MQSWVQLDSESLVWPVMYQRPLASLELPASER
jgi:hypothetical protein